jgi:hypothetical protein
MPDIYKETRSRLCALNLANKSGTSTFSFCENQTEGDDFTYQVVVHATVDSPQI